MLFWGLEVALAQIEQHGLHRLVEPARHLVARHRSLQTVQVGRAQLAQAAQHQGPQHLVLQATGGSCALSKGCGKRQLRCIQQLNINTLI